MTPPEQSVGTAPGPDPEKPREGYQPPAVLWEQEFIALATTSIPPPKCEPGSSPECTP